jgi:hypothetical protein
MIFSAILASKAWAFTNPLDGSSEYLFSSFWY